jgi:hypothetical protein
MKRKIALSFIIGLFAIVPLNIAGEPVKKLTNEEKKAINSERQDKRDFDRALYVYKLEKHGLESTEEEFAKAGAGREKDQLEVVLAGCKVRFKQAQEAFDAACKKSPQLAMAYAKAEVERLTKELADAQELLKKIGG